MPRVFLPSRAPQLPERVGGSAPDPTFLEGAWNTFRASDNSEGGDEARKEEALNNAYAQIVDELNRRGLASDAYTSREIRNMGTLTYNDDAIWAGVQAAKARDPKAFAALPGTLDAFRAATVAPVQARMEREAERASRSGWGGWLTGSFALGATDPINQVAMLSGAGEAKTIGQAVLKDAILNARVTAMEQPVIAFERARDGKHLSAGEAVQNVALGAGLGAVMGGAIKGAELHVAAPVGDAIASTREAGIAAVWDHLPQAVRDRWGSAANIKPQDMPNVVEMTVGHANMSADEKAAATVIRREAEVAQSNPYESTGAGIATHQEQMADAMSRILADEPPPPPRPRYAGELRGSTSLSSGVVDPSARAAVKSRIAVAESRNGALYANPLSSARGKYQFINDTWKSYYLRRFGRGGLSDAEILAKRSDGHLQEVLMDDMLADNADFLRRNGQAETAGNLYLTHFAGQGGAKKLFEADPRASAASLLGEKVISVNPFLRDMTAGDVIAWAHERMGERGPARSIGAGCMSDSPEAPVQDRLQAEIDRLGAERTRLEQGAPDEPVLDGAAPEAEWENLKPVFADTGDVAMPREDVPRAAVQVSEPMAPASGAQSPYVEPGIGPTAEQLGHIEAVRAHIANRDRRLDPASIGRALGMSEVDAREALSRLADRPDSGLIRTKGRMVPRRDAEGNFIYRDRGSNGQRVRVMEYQPGRIRRASVRTGPSDVMRFLADHGGIADNEGHALLKGRDMRVMVPGSGALVRPRGMSIDAAGELLHEAGYFPSGGPRPTVDDVLQLLERARREKVFPLHEQAAPDIVAENADALHADFEEQKARLAAYIGLHDPAFEDLPQDYLEHAAELVMTRGMEPKVALVEAANRYAKDELDAAWHESENPAYDWRPEPDQQPGGEQGALADWPKPGEPGYDAFAREAEARRDRASSLEHDGETSGLDPAPINAESAAAFADPIGPAAKAQAESLEHDFRAEIDPAIAERQKQQADLKAASPMRAKADQESSIGAPLFDAADQVEFGFGPGKAPLTVAEILDHLDAEEDVIKNVRDCL